MRKSLKKLLSIVLAVVMLASALSLSLTAFAEGNTLTFVTNGGTWADGFTVPTEYTYDQYNTVALPGHEDLSKEGAIFAGWYDNDGLTGRPSYVIPANTTGDKTYYASWVSIAKVVENFDAKTDAKDWYDWTGAAKATMSHALNTNADYSYSGNNSIMFQINKGKNDAMYTSDSDRKGVFSHYNASFVPDDESVTDGLSFWVYSTYASALTINMNCWSPNTQGGTPTYNIEIPAGASFITIPWTAWGDVVTQKSPGQLSFIFYSVWNLVNNVYVDELSSYKNVYSGSSVSFETNGGTFVGSAGDVWPGHNLPNASAITKEGCQFVGWYENAEFTGTPASVAKANTKYYAKWVYFISFDNLESQTGVNDPWVIYGNSGDAFVAPPSLNTNPANAWDGTKSIKIDLKNQKSVGGGWNQWECIGLNANINGTRNTEGLYFYIKSNFGNTGLRVVLNPNGGEQSGTYMRKDLSITSGDNHFFIPWSEFGEGVTENTATSFNFVIQARWTKAEDNYDTGTVYIDSVGAYSNSEIAPEPAPVEPSYGIATPGDAGLFFAVQSENSGITITKDSAVYSYEEGGPLYTAFRVFGTYTAPDNGGVPDFGWVVVGEGDKRELVSRHIMLGYKTEPTIEKNYVMTNAKGDFDKCWDFDQNPDGTWKVTYSLLLKDIPAEYAATAFNVKSAIVTKKGTIEETIYSDEMVEGVSAQAIYDGIPGQKPAWFN